MAGQSGIYWFTDPDVIAQKLSLAAVALGDETEDIVRNIVEEGADFMRQRIMTGGVEGGMFTGGPRAETYAMYNSVDGRVSLNTRGRVQGEMGYIDGEPFYAKFHERGTSSPGIGIKPLHAMADALFGLQGKMEVAADRALTRVWNNVWS